MSVTSPPGAGPKSNSLAVDVFISASHAARLTARYGLSSVAKPSALILGVAVERHTLAVVGDLGESQRVALTVHPVAIKPMPFQLSSQR